MTDPTHSNLALAFLDQQVEGVFANKPHAYVAVIADKGYGLGVAIEDERGYHPITGLDLKTHDEARTLADGMNMHIGLSKARVISIVASSMRRGA